MAYMRLEVVQLFYLRLKMNTSCWSTNSEHRLERIQNGLHKWILESVCGGLKSTIVPVLLQSSNWKPTQCENFSVGMKFRDLRAQLQRQRIACKMYSEYTRKICFMMLSMESRLLNPMRSKSNAAIFYNSVTLTLAPSHLNPNGGLNASIWNGSRFSFIFFPHNWSEYYLSLICYVVV
ncbi:hypothetical protein Hanom_Chr02g00143011 [Helianthus anomalus]